MIFKIKLFILWPCKKLKWLNNKGGRGTMGMKNHRRGDQGKKRRNFEKNIYVNF